MKIIICEGEGGGVEYGIFLILYVNMLIYVL